MSKPSDLRQLTIASPPAGERRRLRQRRDRALGFSLIELLIVVAIIGIIAIPNLLVSRRAANEASAIQAVRTIKSAQAFLLRLSGLAPTA